MPSQTIIIDCDPGIDDAVALLLALASPDELDLLAVTAVCGNVSLDLTERNARRVLALAARPEVPVYPGAGRPIMIAHHGATVHGDDGLGGVPLPEPASAPQQRGAVDYLLETLAGGRAKFRFAVSGR